MHEDEPVSLSADDAARIVDLLHRMEPLKHLPRTGWVDRDVASPESVAAHSWRLAMLAWLVAEAIGLDAAHALRLALVHDLPEAVTGDRTPFADQGLSPQEQRARFVDPHAAPDWRTPEARREKVARERRALHEMLAGQRGDLRDMLFTAWDEYEAGVTPEARLVSQLDKLEAFAQGLDYAHDGRLSDAATLNSFRYDCERLLHDVPVRALLRALEQWARTGV